MLLHNKYIPHFTLFYLPPPTPLRKGSHCGSVNTEFTRWDVDRNSLVRGIPSGNKDFNGLGLNREFPKGGNPERGIPRRLLSGIPLVTVARVIPQIQDGGFNLGQCTDVITSIQLISYTQPFIYSLFMQ